MKAVVSEPQVQYKITGWQIEPNNFSFDDFIYGIENETILFYRPSRSVLMILPEKSKKRLSDLRGKMSKQSEKEIDAQISSLRSEWDKNCY